jgi:hypothetical protein
MPKNFFFEMTYDKFKKIADYRKAAVATLTYIATRENQQGEEMNRTLFGRERTYQLEEAIEFVNAIQMKQLRLWHVTWSPAPITEINEKKDLDLRKIAKETMRYLQAIHPTMEFIVAEHNDHSDIPHVQGLVFVNGWISRDDLIEMGKIALQKALEQRRSLDRGIDLVPLLQQSAQRTFEKSRAIGAPQLMHQFTQHSFGMAGGRANHAADTSKKVSHRQIRKSREPTLACPNGMSHKVVKWKGKDFCTVDKKVVEQSMALEL